MAAMLGASARCSALRRALLTAARFGSGGPSAEAIAKMQESFKKNPAAAQAVFASTSELTNGMLSRAKIRSFAVSADEPKDFGGDDTSPNPVELLLFSLGACQEITTKAFANAMGVPLTRVSSDLKGSIDLRGFFAVDDSVRPGFNKIEGTLTVESPADVETIKKLKEAVDAHCPVKDMLGAVPMEVVLKHVQD